MTRKGHRLLPHTADLLVEVRADDFPSLCAASVEALFSLVTDRRKVRRAAERTLESPGGSPEERLQSTLRQALLLFSLDRFLVREASVRMDGDTARVTLRGETVDPDRHALCREIKAVTRHGLTFSEDPSGVTARFLLDV